VLLYSTTGCTVFVHVPTESCRPRQQHVMDILQTGTHHNEVRHVVVHSTTKPYNALQSRYNISKPCMYSITPLPT
jgi:hypothetical protein